LSERRETRPAANASANRLPPTLAAELFEESLHAVPTIDLRDIGARLLAPLVKATGSNRASLMLVNPDTGKLRIVAGVGLAQELIGRDVEWRPSSISEWVFRKRQGLVLNGDVRQEGLVGIAQGQVESSMCVPMDGDAGPIGVLNLACSGQAAPFREDEMHAVCAMLPPVGAAIERALLANLANRSTGQLMSARGLVHRTLLAPGHHEARNFEIGYARVSSARSGSAACERVPIASGGHVLLAMEPRAEGIDGLLTAAFAQGVFVTGSTNERSASAVFAGMNTELCSRLGDKGETAAWIGQLTSGGMLTTCNAGYPSPLWVPSDDSPITSLASTGPMLGADPGSRWEEEQARLLPGDVFVVMSTGMLGARNVTGQPFGHARLAECIAEWRRLPLDRLTEDLIRAVIDWSGRPAPVDDLTVLAVRYAPGD
jgi:hypothetical protein